MILGIDVSHWNGVGDWLKAKAAGIKFAFIRAGSIEHSTGTLYEDGLFRLHAEGARAAGIPRGYYWYFRPYHEPSRQAAYFLRLADEMGYELPLVCDVEYSINLTPKENSWSINRFLNVLDDQSDKIPIIYTRASWWNISVSPESWWHDYTLWAARYNAILTSPWSDDRFKFRDWDTWTFWQFSADNNGRAKEFGFGTHPSPVNPTGNPEPDIDLNYYNGDEAQFKLEFAIDTPPPPMTLEQRVSDLERRVSNLESVIVP